LVSRGRRKTSVTTAYAERTPPSDVADVAPAEHKLLAYDREHAVTYMRLMDADKVGADWREVARIVLHIDPDQDADRARRTFDTHMARARWMCRHGYRQLLRDGWP
jgi:hypothetical protein